MRSAILNGIPDARKPGNRERPPLYGNHVLPIRSPAPPSAFVLRGIPNAETSGPCGLERSGGVGAESRLPPGF
jgi:hypothetical protein